MVTTTKNVHGAPARFQIFLPEEGASSRFVVFQYGDAAHLTHVFLTVEQTVALGAQFAEAVAGFQRDE